MSTDLPLPLHTALDRLGLSGRATEVSASMARVQVHSHVVQDYRPMAESLEWDLADAYWAKEGVRPFVGSEVPFIVNNSGRASEDAATVFFAACREAPGDGRLAVLEIGAGTGLFALHFLNAMRSLCEDQHADFYSRLVYYVSDRSRRTVEQWVERGLFAAHADHVVLGVCGANRPASFERLSGAEESPSRLRAVFCNYVLDVLPSAILRRGAEGPEQLCVRTHLTNHSAALPQYSTLTLEEVRARGVSDNAAVRAELLPILNLLEFESKFLPVSEEALPGCHEALEFGAGLSRVTYNYGAIEAVAECLALLSDDGYLHLNDYGPSKRDELPEHAQTQRFGSSTAMGINLPLLDHHFQRNGYHVLAAPDDDARPIHARIVTKRSWSAARETFDRVYSGAAWHYMHQPAEDARLHAASGRNDDALECYRTALARNPRDWHLIGLAAEFVGLQLRDFASGIDLARAALELNPYYSTSLWNVLGDCLFCTQRFDEAHEAYLQASRLNANDVRTNFNLAYTYAQRALFGEALAAVARGLTHDTTAAYRERLLEKQLQILATISTKELSERERVVKRALSFAS